MSTRSDHDKLLTTKERSLATSCITTTRRCKTRTGRCNPCYSIIIGDLNNPFAGQDPKHKSVDMFFDALFDLTTRVLLEDEQMFDEYLKVVINIWLQVWEEVAPTVPIAGETSRHYQQRKTKRTTKVRCYMPLHTLGKRD